ncbi:hypothetical protein [Paenarthrobacter sp. FR1]|uniref:hypothetical protein n=1 Tax=Paenarthrobacter sp. FR1 TaxID=3439548 RepID=UPI003DA64650
MTAKNYHAAAARAWQEANVDDDESGYVTPYLAVTETLRTQNSKARGAASEMLQDAFGLHAFDAATVARSAADLTQLREAIRSPRIRRFGQFKITYIEFDVVTWRVLPSVENIRFEGERAWKSGKALRYGPMTPGEPVLGLSWPDPDELISSLTQQTQKIWNQNPHSKSIPFRGIETPGLLAVARLALGDGPKIGVLDATDGFSRTVGAQRGSGIGISDVLFDLQEDAAENRLRQELIGLRDSGEADLDSEAAAVSAARLRSSIMPRAQVIVAYSKIGTPEKQQPSFDEVRRSLVGHIHLEPPLTFADTTKFALKSRIALDEVHAKGLLPKLEGFSTERILSILQAETTQGGDLLADEDSTVPPLFADEVLALAFETLVAQGNRRRVLAVNSAVYGLTGKRPSREERAALAADAALRANWIIAGKEEDTAFKGRRSTMQKVLATTTLSGARLSRRPILDLVNDAVEKLQIRNQNLDDVSREISSDAAELGVLGLYCLVEGGVSPLLIRSTAKVGGEYLPEPQQIVERMVTSISGIQQLGQVILDVRAGFEPRLLKKGQNASDRYLSDNQLLTREDLFRYKKDGWASSTDLEAGPESRLLAYRQRLIDSVEALQSTFAAIQRIESEENVILVDSLGLDVDTEFKVLSEIVTELGIWTRLASRRSGGSAVERSIDSSELLEELEDDLEYQEYDSDKPY